VVDVGGLGYTKPKILGVYAPSVPLRELREATEMGRRAATDPRRGRGEPEQRP